MRFGGVWLRIRGSGEGLKLKRDSETGRKYGRAAEMSEGKGGEVRNLDLVGDSHGKGGGGEWEWGTTPRVVTGVFNDVWYLLPELVPLCLLSFSAHPAIQRIQH